MTWKFDDSVAKVFVNHARQHIPNYDLVLHKSVEVCEHLLPKTSKIIDIGCATGNTLDMLTAKGFTNITGIDSSQSMLNQCRSSAKLIHSDKFPEEKFDAVLCNWTLHFIKDKISYLTDCYQGLNDNGFMILSEKTSVDVLPIHFYHQYKLKAGVSYQAIKEKEQSVKDVMFIDSPEWYIQNLKTIGFDKIYIIDAHWCFTTFLCLK